MFIKISHVLKSTRRQHISWPRLAFGEARIIHGLESLESSMAGQRAGWVGGIGDDKARQLNCMAIKHESLQKSEGRA